MAVVSFDMTFSYVAAGWEGSASDQAVLRWAVTSGGFVVPEGKLEIHEFIRMQVKFIYIVSNINTNVYVIKL